MKITNLASIAVIVVLVFYLLKAGEALLLPLVIAIAFWYLINLLATLFGRVRVGEFHMPIPLCYLFSIFSFLGFGWGLVTYLASQIEAVGQVIPTYQENIAAQLAEFPLPAFIQIDETGLLPMIIEWIDIESRFASFALSFTSALTSGGLILIYMMFLFLEQGNFDKKLTVLVRNEKSAENARRIITKIRNDIRKYMGIKILTSSLTGILSYAFLSFVGVDFAGVWGLLIFLLNFIPTVGSIVATIFPVLIAVAQFEGITMPLVVLLGIMSLQICIGQILEPRFMGKSFNLSPIIIILNLALWNTIWGVWGMFLCVPLLIITTIVLAHFPQTRSIAVMLSSDGVLNFIEE